MDLENRAFYGQQEDEVILYEIRPHWTRKFIAALMGIFLWLIILRTAIFFSDKTRLDPEYLLTGGFIFGLIVGLLTVGWFWYSADIARAFITDRRFVRLEAAFPFFVNRRSLFWNEVLKVKGYAPNIIFRLAKVGTLAIQPLMSETGKEDVKFGFVYYFGDIANYIDKIIFTYKTKSDEVKNIRPFVPRPAGERY